MVYVEHLFPLWESKFWYILGRGYLYDIKPLGMESLKGFPGQMLHFRCQGKRCAVGGPLTEDTERKEACTWIPLMPFPLMIWLCNFVCHEYNYMLSP